MSVRIISSHHRVPRPLSTRWHHVRAVDTSCERLGEPHTGTLRIRRYGGWAISITLDLEALEELRDRIDGMISTLRTWKDEDGAAAMPLIKEADRG